MDLKSLVKTQACRNGLRTTASKQIMILMEEENCVVKTTTSIIDEPDIESINKTEKQHYEHRFLLTVDMMYRKLAKALHETNIQGIFFKLLPCLCC